MNEDFTFDRLREAVKRLPPYFTESCFISHDTYNCITKDEGFKTVNAPIIGIKIYIKPSQQMAGWLISDKEIERQYLTGEITELDLVKMLKNGSKKLATITQK